MKDLHVTDRFRCAAALAALLRLAGSSLGRRPGALAFAVIACAIAAARLGAQSAPAASPAAAPPAQAIANGTASTTLSVKITSPLGRTGMTGAVRIVARVTPVPGTSLSPVQFFVDSKLVGEDKDGPPYAVEWLDENPLEMREIAVQVADSSGGSARDVLQLRPLEIIERAFVSSVILEPSVRDERGRPVNGLTAEDFIVREDGLPQQIDFGSPDTVPANYTLLIDSSQSMSRRMDFVRDAARQLPERLRGDDRVTVVPFSRTLGTVTGPTQDRDTIVGAIQGIRASGGTAILDCLAQAVRQLRAADGRHIVVLITDGYDENSDIAFAEALAAVKDSKATVYVIAIGGVAGVSLRGEDVLKRLAAETGGRAFFPSREFQLSDVHGLIASDVQQRYVLTYTPTNQRLDGSWREVTVATHDPKHVVTVRAGYTSPEPPPIKPQIELTIRDLARQHLDVTPADFAVFEDGIEQTVEGFEEALTPVNVMLVLDQSGSIRKDAEAVMEAARTFARQLPGKDRVGVILFDDRPVLVQDLTTIREFILRAIDKYQANGGTALYDAIGDSLVRLQKAGGRTAIVVLTDGRDEDNPGTGPGSVRSLDQVMTTLKEVGSTVYAIGLGPNVDRVTLERLAAESGGEAYFPADVSVLGADYRRILENLRRRYVISYTSTNRKHDGAWRKVEIRPSREGIAIDSAGGYFAPEQP
jgi:Ca-activated chloride channel family protein